MCTERAQLLVPHPLPNARKLDFRAHSHMYVLSAKFSDSLRAVAKVTL